MIRPLWRGVWKWRGCHLLHPRFWTCTWWEAFHWTSFIHLVHLLHTRKFSAGSWGASTPCGPAEHSDNVIRSPSFPHGSVHMLCLDKEPVTSNSRKTQLCVWEKSFDHVAGSLIPRVTCWLAPFFLYFPTNECQDYYSRTSVNITECIWTEQCGKYKAFIQEENRKEEYIYLPL